MMVAGVERQVDEAAGHLLPAVGVHTRVAVRSEGLLPFGGDEDGFIAQGDVAGGAAEAGHAADPLTEGGTTVMLAPPAHVITRRREPGSASEAFQHVVTRHVEIELTGLLDLLLKAAVEQANAAVVKGLQPRSGCDSEFEGTGSECFGGGY